MFAVLATVMVAGRGTHGFLPMRFIIFAAAAPPSNPSSLMTVLLCNQLMRNMVESLIL
jgi:hypothetical protein